MDCEKIAKVLISGQTKAEKMSEQSGNDSGRDDSIGSFTNSEDVNKLRLLLNNLRNNEHSMEVLREHLR